MEIDHEIFSTVILPLPLIQEGQLSVYVCLGKLTMLDMTHWVDWAVKPQHKQILVKMLTVLVRTISNSQVFLLKKCWLAFANAKATHIFFSKNISVYAIFNIQSFNDMLTNYIVSFEHLGPDV